MSKGKSGGEGQALDENLETMTASAISTPHRHFSHTIWPHVPAHPAPITLRVSSVFPPKLPFGLMMGAREGSGFVRDTEGVVDEVDDEMGVEAAFGLLSEEDRPDDDCVAGFVRGGPLSFSPIFGKSRRWGVQ